VGKGKVVMTMRGAAKISLIKDESAKIPDMVICLKWSWIAVLKHAETTVQAVIKILYNDITSLVSYCRWWGATTSPLLLIVLKIN
jgi:hypothetical protein